VKLLLMVEIDGEVIGWGGLTTVTEYPTLSS